MKEEGKTNRTTPLAPLERGMSAESPIPLALGCQRGGVLRWDQLPYNPALKERARKLRKAKNLPEVVFWKQVKGKRFLGLDFDRQKVIGNYIVDFYCKSLGVIVEIDGSSHDHKQEYDQRRDDYLTGLGLKIIHITVRELMRNLNGVLTFLTKELGQDDPT